MKAQIKVYETVDAIKDMEYAAQAGAEGFVNVIEVADVEQQTFVFSKDPIYSYGVKEKITNLVNDGFDFGDTFLFYDDEYEVIA